MKAWCDKLNANGKVDMISDWDAAFTKFLGMDGLILFVVWC